MKTFFSSKTIIALAVAVATAACAVNPAHAQPVPPSAGDSVLPADIVPGSPLADVVKMLQAGVDVGTLKSYIQNSQSAFNLDADKIIFLKDEGASTDIINAMMERDKVLYASTVAPAPVSVTAAPAYADTAPPPAEVTVNYFYDSLTPYGSWVNVDGYGRCWRPTAVIYDSGWRPYCDRGHWVYTDYGWYWDSDYSWGVTFHYGRWFHHARFGWCWYPDTVWAPSWVTWRSGGEYCGWAPLPPFAVFRPGFGFFFNGARVALDFDFGLDATCFMFVSPEHFCDRHPRSFCVPSARAPLIFRQTTVINNYNVNNTTIVNRGIAVEHISGLTHRTIEPVRISSLPNAGRQGWRGEGFNRSQQHSVVDNTAGRNLSSTSDSLHHGSTSFNNNQNTGANLNRRDTSSQPSSGTRPGGNQVVPLHSQVQSYSQSGGNSQVQSQNGSHETLSSQSRQFNGNTGSGRTTSQNDWQQNRSVERPAATVPQQHFATQLEQRQVVTPSQPRVEQRQTIPEAAPRNYNPPPSAPAPSSGQPHNSGSGSGQGSDRQNQQNH